MSNKQGKYPILEEEQIQLPEVSHNYLKEPNQNKYTDNNSNKPLFKPAPKKDQPHQQIKNQQRNQQEKHQMPNNQRQSKPYNQYYHPNINMRIEGSPNVYEQVLFNLPQVFPIIYPGSTTIIMNNSNNRPHIPSVNVNCQYCTYEQVIPGYCPVFLCCQCHKKNLCQPQYGTFICYVCQQQICYKYGQSQTIRCGVCKSVNKVSLFDPNTIKNQQDAYDQLNKKAQERNIKLNKVQSKEVNIKNYFEENQI